MMVPRSYLHSSHAPMVSTKRDEKATRPAAVEGRAPPRSLKKNESTSKSTMLSNPFSPPPATASKPVVIPTRTRDGARRKSRDPVPKSRERKASQEVSSPHDASSTPSSVAALLAMTSLSDTKDRLRSEGRRNEAQSILGNDYRESPRRSISSSSPQSWGMLLSPPEEDEQESGSFESDTTLGPVSSLRSMSTESMPSLETDTESLGSASYPATPGMAMSNRRQKSIATSVGKDCGVDHPLQPRTQSMTLEDDDDDDDEPSVTLSPPPPAAAKTRSSFKSNLTASFRKIRSTAQSFANFATPPNHREDYLSRSLFAPQYVDEKWPESSVEPPDPATRRYLNPVTFSPSEFHYHSDQESSQTMRPNCTASIQMQTYRRRSRSSDKATAPPVFTASQQKAMDAVDGLPQASPRQREPRENSDFLRIIVLEMNMRKQGWLNGDEPGRARLWLPARKAGKVEEEEQQLEKKRKIPARWAGVKA